jgi:UDP-N-acetylglucosamine transferase subunit ALG13
MILVTVGTHPQGFERLVRAADELAHDLDERMVIQFGSSKHVPQHAEHFAFTSGEEMEGLMREARVVVAHAAAGTVLLALRECKPLVVVPRLRALHEIFDDHQRQLAKALQESGRALTVNEPDARTLREAIRLSDHLTGQPTISKQPLIQAVTQQIQYWTRVNTS